MTHPTPADLLELHFGEAGGVRAARLRAHVQACSECRSCLDDVVWAERLIRELPIAEPPADGLERVLARVASSAAGDRRPAAAWRAIAPSAAAIAAGALAMAVGGVGAALVFFAAGSLVTLSLAPALILDSQRPKGATAR
jgi:hypothetical protein